MSCVDSQTEIEMSLIDRWTQFWKLARAYPRTAVILLTLSLGLFVGSCGWMPLFIQVAFASVVGVLLGSALFIASFACLFCAAWEYWHEQKFECKCRTGEFTVCQGMECPSCDGSGWVSNGRQGKAMGWAVASLFSMMIGGALLSSGLNPKKMYADAVNMEAARTADLATLKREVALLPKEHRKNELWRLLFEVAESQPGIPGERVRDAAAFLLDSGAPLINRKSTVQAIDFALGKTKNPEARVPLTQIFLERGWKPSSAAGMNAIRWAEPDSAIEILELLHAHGVRWNDKDRKGQTPLMVALFDFDSLDRPSVRLPITKWLLEHGANVNATDKDSRTVLHHFCAKPNREAELYLDVLLEAGARVDLTDKFGNTPLHQLARAPLSAVDPLFQRLIRAGAKLDTKNRAGRTPRDEARLEKNDVLAAAIDNAPK